MDLEQRMISPAEAFYPRVYVSWRKRRAGKKKAPNRLRFEAFLLMGKRFTRLSAGCPRFPPAFCRGPRTASAGAGGCCLAFLFFFAFLTLSGGLHVDLLGELGQLLVSLLLFFESFLQKG